jgi:hypothetical protein
LGRWAIWSIRILAWARLGEAGGLAVGQAFEGQP